MKEGLRPIVRKGRTEHNSPRKFFPDTVDLTEKMSGKEFLLPGNVIMFLCLTVDSHVSPYLPALSGQLRQFSIRRAKFGLTQKNMAALAGLSQFSVVFSSEPHVKQTSAPVYVCLYVCMCVYIRECVLYCAYACNSKENGGQVFEKEEGIVYGKVWNEKGERR